MIITELSLFLKKQFTVKDPSTKYTCVGIGQTGKPYVIGALFDAPNNRTTLKTFLLEDVTFLGQLN